MERVFRQNVDDEKVKNEKALVPVYRYFHEIAKNIKITLAQVD
jgi:hypothetical protein